MLSYFKVNKNLCLIVFHVTFNLYNASLCLPALFAKAVPFCIFYINSPSLCFSTDSLFCTDDQEIDYS